MQGVRKGLLPDAQQEAFDMQPRVLVDPWSCECVEALASWRSGSPVSPIELTASVNRRKRLAALGNALVPQIAEAIGRAILRVEREIHERDTTINRKAGDQHGTREEKARRETEALLNEQP